MKKLLGKGSLKAIVAGSLAVALFAGGFVLANNYVFGSSMENFASIPTSYQAGTNLPEKSSTYQKADYKVLENKLLICDNANALSADEAAELGAQYLWDLFQADLSGKVVYMSYTVDPSRKIGYWNGDVYENESAITDIMSPSDYSFSIEAISGKRNTALLDMSKLDAKETILYKESEAEVRFKDSIEECRVLAKTVAEKQLPGDVVKAEFKSTGSVLAPGYEIEIPEGATTTYTSIAEEPIQEEPDLIKVSMDDEYEASHVFIIILVTDTNGNQVEIEFDMASKTMMSIQSIYKGIDYDPDSVG